MNFKEWQEWWNEIAPTYFTDKCWIFSQPKLIQKLHIQKDQRVLEIGFGYGRELLNFCELSNDVWGAELTQWACDNTAMELKQRGCRISPTLFAYDGLRFPDLLNDSFDVIYNCFVVQHLSREHAKTLIRGALNLLTATGQCLFEFYGDPEFYNNGMDVFSGVDGQGGMFNNAFVREELEKFVSECGGKVQWIETIPITRQWGNHWVCFSK